ncbi:unnamed protein product [Debaryomyces fabryi]|nr:unnamed protein product [Debaryomyces fabryi]
MFDTILGTTYIEIPKNELFSRNETNLKHILSPERAQDINYLFDNPIDFKVIEISRNCVSF